MRLKRVRIFGFKTFADKAEFSLDGGVIAVVGPNGCGKSNLVDAILWGLGEGNARHLRASHSQDVIFSGSANRKAVGYAEVSLCFDNEDGALPIDASEVWITRRLTRSGESDYTINRASCRQRDVLELLADSGLGRAGYAIVGQKEIDQALSASAEDRRAWIDEAAGVQRYRVRKIDSLKRLAQTQEHLSRVTDILRELESQRAPLQKEAEVALRYKSAVSALREVEIGLLIADLCSAVKESRELEARIKDSTKLLQQEHSRAEKLDREVQVTGEVISDLERKLDAARALQQSLLTTLERADGAQKLVDQKLLGLDELELSLQEDAESLQKRIETATQELAEASTEHQQELANLEKVQVESAGAGAEAKELTQKLRIAESELNQARNRHSQQLKREAEKSAKSERLKSATRELQGVENSLPDLTEAIESAQKEYDEAQAGVTTHESKVAELRAEIQQIREENETDSQRVRKAMSEWAALEGRKRGIEATLETYEGMSQGSRAVMEASEKGTLDGEYTPVASAITVEKEFALAIETALGASGNDLIVDSESDAKRAIEFLKANRSGRATFQPIPLMRPPDISSELRRLENQIGIVGRASNLLQTENRFRPVIESLLARVLVVETIDDAIALTRSSNTRNAGWSRVVTLEGEVVHSSGAVTGGLQRNQSYGLVQRKADLVELENQLSELNKIVGQFENRQAARESKILGLEAELSKSLALSREAIRPAKEAKEYLQTLSDELKLTERQKAKLESEIKQLSDTGQESSEPVDVAAFEKHRDEILHVLASRSADAEQAEARLIDARTRASQAQSRWLSAQRRLDSAKEADSLRGRKMENLEPERLKLKEELAKIEAEKAVCQGRKAEVETSLVTLNTQRREQLEKSLAFAEEARAARENYVVIGEANHQTELNRTRAESRRANAAERLMDSYGLTEEDALAQEGVHVVPDDGQTVVSRLRREIKAMGDVNIGAVEAYERLNDRHEELQAQHDDVLNGVRQVEASIQELDKLTRDRFITAFTQVRDAFAETFTQLFGGGTAELSLTDTEKVLESGVDISVQLPGKRKQALQLLSGGERSLCASAFLFALLKVKPAPLVVLDEVDAPLDGRNVERFAQMLAEFSTTIQFIVITHNPVTIEVAPIWLGVTMQDPGISTLVPARMKESKAVVKEQSNITFQ